MTRTGSNGKPARFIGEWNISDHSCRHCMGRVLIGQSSDGLPLAHCSECGEEMVGGHDAICWCGVEMPGHGRTFECFHNPRISLSAPQEIRVRERPLPVGA